LPHAALLRAPALLLGMTLGLLLGTGWAPRLRSRALALHLKIVHVCSPPSRHEFTLEAGYPHPDVSNGPIAYEFP
jgi:hypothetical protein